jgi:hypothetical protein
MKILLVNTSSATGGAAVATRRLMDALEKNGAEVKMLVRDKDDEADNNVVALSPSWKLKWNFLWERFVIWIHNKLSRKNLFAVDIANT